MKTLLRKLRGVLGFSVLGGVVGGLWGIVSLGLHGLWPWELGPLVWSVLLGGVVPKAWAGAVIGGGLSVGFATLSHGRALRDISLRRAALYGALAGTLVLPFQVALFIGAPYLALISLPVLVKSTITWGLVGATSAVAALETAQYAERYALAASEDTRFVRGEVS